MSKIRMEVTTTLYTADDEELTLKFGKLLGVRLIEETEEDGYVNIYLVNGTKLPYVDRSCFSTIGTIEVKKNESTNSKGNQGEPRSEEIICENELSGLSWAGDGAAPISG